MSKRGRPIVKSAPLSSAKPEVSEVSTDELVRAGVLRLPDQSLDQGFWSLPRPDDPEAAALNALLQERREGR